MPFTLYFKRAKCFVLGSTSTSGTKKFLAQPGPSPQQVPFWVAETPTFQHGVKDGSIVNLTAYDAVPAKYQQYLTQPSVVPPTKKAAAPAPTPVDEDEEVPAEQPETKPAATDDDEDGEEQTETPEAPFGAQPMTPVPPAPKVGRVSASAKKR